jgi:hypothetical protein
MRPLVCLATVLGLPSRYDALLVGLSVTFLIAYLFGSQLLSSRPITAGFASLVSAVFVVDGLFWHPPQPEQFT